jgi:hypothetical protein
MGRYRIAASEWIDGDEDSDNISQNDNSIVVSHHRTRSTPEDDKRRTGPLRPRQHPNFFYNDHYYLHMISEDGTVTFALHPSEFNEVIDSRSGRRRNRSAWRWHIGSTLMVVIAYFCYYSNHLPPAPPPSVVFFLSRNGTQVPPTWGEFLHDHTWQWLDSTLALGVQAPYAIAKYWAMMVLIDLQLSFHRWSLRVRNPRIKLFGQYGLLSTSPSTSRPPIFCQWHVPLPQDDMGAWITMVRESNASIVGQEIAVDWLANSIYSWQHRKRTVTTPERTSNREDSVTAGPLVVLATGYEHTGKRTLAYRIMTSAWRTGSGCHSHPEEQILHVKGRDWVLQDFERGEDSYPSTQRMCRRRYHQLISVIESHVYRSQSRTLDDTMMILISNVEEMEPCILVQFLKNLQRKDFHLNAISRILDDDPDEAPASGAPSSLHELCRNSIIYLTSNTLGLSSLARFLRQGDRNRSLGLAVDLRDAVQRELPDPALVPVVHAIVPFLPFTPHSLGELFRHRLKEYWNIYRATPIQLLITEAAVAALLNDDVVEYVEVGRPSETIKLVVDGAQALPEHPFLNHWYTQLHQVMELLPPEPQRTASLVLDCDHSMLSSMLLDRGVWQLCDGRDGSEGEDYENCVVLRRVRM